MSKKGYNIKCKPDCKYYDKLKPYTRQQCIYLHKMYYERLSESKQLRYQDNKVFKNKDLFKYHRLRNRKQELVINTSICYLDFNSKKSIDKRFKSNVPTF